MKSISLLIVLALLAIAGVSPALAQTTQPIVWRYPDRTSPAGLARYPEISALGVWHVAKETEPGKYVVDVAIAEGAGRTVTGTHCVINFEAWYAAAGANEDTAIRLATDIATTLDAFKKTYKGKVGVYGWLPQQHTSWALVNDMQAPDKLPRFQRRNEVIADVLLPRLDFLAPDCYVRHDTPEEVRASNALMIAECRRLAKRAGRRMPVYLFVWHRYWQGEKGLPTGELLTWDMWRAVLLSARADANGLIVYTEAGRPAAEDDVGCWQCQLNAYREGWRL